MFISTTFNILIQVYIDIRQIVAFNINAAYASRKVVLTVQVELAQTQIEGQKQLAVMQSHQ